MKINSLVARTVVLSAALMTLPAHAARDAERERANKAIVTDFVAGINGKVDADTVARRVAPQLIEHDPLSQSGRAGTAAWIRALRQTAPAQAITVKHLLADGDMVFVHSQLSATPDEEKSGTNRYDFYRLDKGLIVEHWLVQAPVPAKSVSGNSAFSDLYVYPGTVPVLTPERVEMNRLFVHTLSDEVFGKRNFGLLDRMWSEGYIQHNPFLANGRAALASRIASIARAGAHYRVVRSVAEGDLAVVCAHSLSVGGDPTNEFSGRAVCDMYRVANFELVEHWDVVQSVPATSLNGNSMFSSLYRPHKKP